MSALETADPTKQGYKGVKPNFGGGRIKEWESIGSTPQKMKKLTTVLSKNQKLHSFNVPLVTKKFERKSNLENELKRQEVREYIAAKQAFVEENLPYLEAFQEVKQVSQYLETEEDANKFVEEAVKLKLTQRLDFKEFDEQAQMGPKKDHPVIPSQKEISMMAIEAASQALHADENSPSLTQIALPTGDSNSLILSKSSKKSIFLKKQKLERSVTRAVDSNFTISKAVNLDNLPEKA